MPRRPPFDRRLLGGLSPDTFLAKYWQRGPLLVRGAVSELASLPRRAALAALAARDDVESRLVTAFDGAWTLAHGPFDRLPRRTRDWTLLVQGVNLHDAAADALMRRFDFVSAMRLDDLMISYAADGGGVGPHLDSYDVFLLQVEGRRRWRWSGSAAFVDVDAWVEGSPLKQLRRFVADDEAVLEPGDLLYLPPSFAHEGVALGPCTTASIGFRAPSWNALTQEFLFAMAERPWPDGLLADVGRKRTTSPGAIDESMLSAIEHRLSRVRWTARDVEAFVGRHFSEPKAHVVFDRPTPVSIAAFARRACSTGLALDPRATLLYRGTRGYIAGESFVVPAGCGPSFRRLADRRLVTGGTATSLVADRDARALLHAWWSDGWIRYAEEASMAHPDIDPQLHPQHGTFVRAPFDTRAAFVGHLRDALRRAEREVWVADRDFADWPLAELAFTAALQEFLRGSAANRFRLLALDTDRIPAAAPRFMQVIRGHAVNAQCRVVPPHAAARFGEACSMMIADRSLLVRRFHRDHPRGAAEFDPAAARPWLDQFEMLWEESSPTLASTTLGLG